MNVLSLFDGISCGQLALQKTEVDYDHYFSSEIDKYAIAVTHYNFPNTIQLGDIISWRDWWLPEIDLLIGGSPCQGFSNAGGGLNFDDPRSKLFFEFVNILKEIKPKYFLLENVKMKKEWQDVISSYLNVAPIEINSALVSAQNRKRLYWTNILNITQPEDKGIFLKDVIESGEVDRDKSYCVDANYYKGGSLKMYSEKKRRQIVNLPSKPIHQSEKRLMVKTIPHGYIKEQIIEREKYPALVGQSPNTKYVIQGAAIRNQWTKHGREEQINIRKDEKSNCVVPTYPEKLNGCVQIDNEITWRKLTPLECERLQTIPNDYTKRGVFDETIKQISNTQRYKMIGNAWTVDVVAHILKGINQCTL